MAKQKINREQSGTSLLGKVEESVSITGFSAETTVATLVVDIPSTNREIKLEAFFPQITATISTDRATIRIKEDGVTVFRSFLTPQSSTGGWCGTVMRVKPSPSAGSHTYTLTVQRDNGTGNLNVYGNNSTDLVALRTLIVTLV